MDEVSLGISAVKGTQDGDVEHVPDKVKSGSVTVSGEVCLATSPLQLQPPEMVKESSLEEMVVQVDISKVNRALCSPLILDVYGNCHCGAYDPEHVPVLPLQTRQFSLY